MRQKTDRRATPTKTGLWESPISFLWLQCSWNIHSALTWHRKLKTKQRLNRFKLITFTVYTSEPIFALAMILGEVTWIINTLATILAGVAFTRVDLSCGNNSTKQWVKKTIINDLTKIPGIYEVFLRRQNYECPFHLRLVSLNNMIGFISTKRQKPPLTKSLV